jgi:uncharacterized integral membrane protein
LTRRPAIAPGRDSAPDARDPAVPDDQARVEAESGPGHVPRTRAGSAWVGLGAAMLIVVALVVFMLQNTKRVDVSFLWMTGRTSLGLILLIAVLAAVLLTVFLGTVRILQLRRLVNRRRK